MVIKLSKKEIAQWNSWDFVKYFIHKFHDNYSDQSYPVNHAKEGMIFYRMVQKFRKNGQSKESVVKFIGWVFSEYLKDPKFTDPLTVGFLPSWVDQYLDLQPEPKKKKRKDPKLSDDMKAWLKEERKRYKPNYGEPI